MLFTVKMVAEIDTRVIKKRHLCCCFVCGFLVGIVAIIGVVVGLVFYFNDLQNKNLNGTSAAQSQCPSEWLYYKDNCYFFSGYNFTWDKAQENCTDMQSHLTDILDQDEASWLGKTCKEKIDNNVWIGGKGINSTDFRWIYLVYGTIVKKNINYSDWAPEQPSFPGQDCIQLWKQYQYKWDNESCQKERKFVCKRHVLM